MADNIPDVVHDVQLKSGVQMRCIPCDSEVALYLNLNERWLHLEFLSAEEYITFFDPIPNDTDPQREVPNG